MFSIAHLDFSQFLLCPVETCSKVFSRMSEWSNHVESVHALRGHPLEPNRLILTKEHDWSRYSMQQLGHNCCIGPREYECPYDHCNRLFQNASNLWNHVNSSQHQRRSYHCPGCSKQFIRVSGMFKHWEYGCPNKEAAANAFAQTMQSFQRLRLA